MKSVSGVAKSLRDREDKDVDLSCKGSIKKKSQAKSRERQRSRDRAGGTRGRHFCLLKLLIRGQPQRSTSYFPSSSSSSYFLLFTLPGLPVSAPWPLLRILSIFPLSLYYVS